MALSKAKTPSKWRTAQQLADTLLPPTAPLGAALLEILVVLRALGYDWFFVLLQLVLTLSTGLVCLSLNSDFALRQFGGNYAWVVCSLALSKITVTLIYPVLTRRVR